MSTQLLGKRASKIEPRVAAQAPAERSPKRAKTASANGDNGVLGWANYSADKLKNLTTLTRARCVLLDGSDPNAKRQEIKAYYRQTSDQFESLFEAFKSDASFFNRSCSLRHPQVFYYAHTACFYANKLRAAKIVEKPVNGDFEALFGIGVDEMSWDDMLVDQAWPPMETVREYRRQVRTLVEKLMDELPLALPITWESPWWILVMGIEHERIHLDTSSVLLRQMQLQYLKPVSELGDSLARFPVCPFGASTPSEAPTNQMIDVRGRHVDYGKSFDHPIYGWDNEYGTKAEDVADFKASKYLVSNAEFDAFIQAGGYSTESFWSREGWRWVTQTSAAHPEFWVPVAADKGFRLRHMYHETEMKWDWPVVTNCLEAAAFCKWKSQQAGVATRLMTEGEWNVLRATGELDRVDQHTWERAPGNINMEYWASECPVDMFEADSGFCDVIGNVWQHTETWFDQFDGFKVHAAYDDFSFPCFDRKHNLIKGGAWMATGNEAHRLSRYAFRRHFFQHAGFRYVQGPALEQVEDDPGYLRSIDVQEQIQFQYGRAEALGVPNWAEAMAKVAADSVSDRLAAGEKLCALDLGCGVGRASFEMAKAGFDRVVGLDWSTRMIGVGVELQTARHFKFCYKAEGDIVARDSRTAMELGFEDVLGRVELLQGDACNLPPKHKDYDVLLCANVLEEVNKPSLLLESLHKSLKVGGVLVFASSFEWDSEKAPKDRWIAGTVDADGETYGRQAVEQRLRAHFALVKGPDVTPWVFPKSRNKFEYCRSDVTVWRRTV